MRAWNLFVLAGAVWLVACGAATPIPSFPAAATPAVQITPLASQASPVATRSPVPADNATPAIQEPIGLTVWVPEDFATGAERGGDVLQAQVAAFQTAQPDITVNYVLKAPYGKGGIVDWLKQLHEWMPERLPDAAIVDTRELDQLEQLGLLQPLGRDLPSGAFWDLFPPARQMARREGKWSDQPLVLDTEHIVYDPQRVESPPATWEQVLAGRVPFAFAADSTESFLLHYLQNGGSLSPTEHPALDASVMQMILEYYQRARASGVLSETTAGMKAAREVLPLFVGGQAPMAQVRARDFLSERSRVPNARAAAVPTRDGKSVALVSGWSYVILANQPERQRAAATYLAWLSDPTNLGEWASAARMIPASKSAFAQAVQPEAYAETLWALLEEGIAAPSFSQQAPYADAWHTAVQAVLTGQLAPDEAAYRALQTITQ